MRSFVPILLGFFGVIEAIDPISVHLSNAPNQRYYMRQTCNALPENTCCVPLDIFIDGIGWDWFRASHILFEDLPTHNVHVTAWKAQPPRDNCNGELVVDHLTIGEATAAYINNSPEGFSGGLYYPQAVFAGNNASVNNTLKLPPSSTRYPDTITFQGEDYLDRGTHDMVYVSRAGKQLKGWPLFGMSADDQVSNSIEAPTNEQHSYTWPRRSSWQRPWQCEDRNIVKQRYRNAIEFIRPRRSR